MIPKILILVCIIVLFTSSEPSTYYNKSPEQYISKIADLSSESTGADLAIIEFDDFGVMWDRDQLNDTLSLIKRRNEESRRGILLLTYIHGWKNNADPSNADGDLALFRKNIKELSKQLRKSKNPAPNHIVAVYMGWRGESSKLPVLSNFTFWGRKRVARRIASHQMQEALLSMGKATKEYPISKVQLMGHSMGGMILSRVITPALTASLTLSGDKGHKTISDLIVLKNPALDGLYSSQFIEFLKLHDVSAEIRSADGTVEPARGPAIVSITSESDWVTSQVYHTGMSIGNFVVATNFREDEDLGLGEPNQEELATNTLGHLDYLISHRAWVEDGKLMLDKVPYSYNDTPFWVIQVSDEISANHSDVDGDRFNELVKKLLEMNRLYDTKAQTWLRKNN